MSWQPPLFEQYRPLDWSEVIGQAKTIAKIATFRNRGIGGRAYWISGQSGTGKTTIAKLLASEVAGLDSIDELDATGMSAKGFEDIARSLANYGLPQDGKTGRAVIVNEAHGIRKDAIRQLLVTLERIPRHAIWIFTTTVEGEADILEDCSDAAPLLSRCQILPLARQGLCPVFAARAKEIAEAEGLGDRPIKDYETLAKRTRNNFRAMLNAIESGDMM
jgi:replication-associated recombination protein RarA